MMRISTKGRYGARLMLDLAVHYEDGYVFLKDVSRREEISEKYLEHLIPPLKASGLISSKRGAQGGYKLARDPSDITLKDIILALEGSISPSECVNVSSICNRAQFCVTRDIWKELEEKILVTLESISLKDMVEMKKEKGEVSLIYSI